MSSKRSVAGGGRAVGVHYEGDLRAALVAAAAARIAEVGVDGLSLRDVARSVGVSHAAPAHHFGDRVGLLTAVATAGFERFVDHLGAAVAAAEDAPIPILQALTRAYADFAATDAGAFTVMFHPTLVRIDDPAYAAASDRAFAALCTVIAHCQALGWRPDGDTRTLAAASWSFAHGVSVLRNQGSLARHHHDVSLDAIVDIATSLLVPDAPDGVTSPRRRRR